MGLWDTLKKEGSLLGDISGVTAVARAVEHPLNWKNDAMAAAVIGSYAFGGPLSRGAMGLGERLLAKRGMEAAPAVIGSELHAAWGTPKVGTGLSGLVAKLTGKRAAGNAALVDLIKSGAIKTGEDVTTRKLPELGQLQHAFPEQALSHPTYYGGGSPSPSFFQNAAQNVSRGATATAKNVRNSVEAPTMFGGEVDPRMALLEQLLKKNGIR